MCLCQIGVRPLHCMVVVMHFPLDLQPDTAIWLREAAVQNLERQQVLEIARHSIESLLQRTRAPVT